MSEQKLINLDEAVVVSPPTLSGPERRAINLLIEEIDRHTRIRLQSAHEWPTDRPVIAVGPVTALQSFAGPYAGEMAGNGDAAAAEGYRIHTKQDGATHAILVVGNDARGVLFGIGHLLRSLHLHPVFQHEPGRIELPAALNITTAPAYARRGHTMGYGDMSNSYGGWDVPQWEQYVRDLVVFGANAIRMAPGRWSAERGSSVHFQLPPARVIPEISRIAGEFGIEFWLSCSALDGDYADASVVKSALDKWEDVFSKTPTIDAIFVAGGDPGHTQPVILMPLLEKLVGVLHRHHPQAQLWVSPQGFTQEWMDEFLGILHNDSPDWLTGIVHGPWVHLTTAQLKKLLPEKYPIQNYPDYTHTLSCQYMVPDWDIAYAMTLGREPINPQPRGQKVIFDRSEPATIGHMAYSEGCSDDVNKALWSQFGWNPDVDVVEVLRQYSRYFLGPRVADDMTQGILALEENWQGALATKTSVYTTLQQFQAMEEMATPWLLKNWRFQQLLYRAYYDAYTRSRLLYESGLEEQALAELRQAGPGVSYKGALVAMDEAERILDRAALEPISRDWRTRIYQLAEALFQSIHMKLSVKLYQGMAEGRGANLDGLDFPLNNRLWLKARFAEIRTLESEDDRIQAIKAVVEWENPGPGGFYDGLGYSPHTPHVVRTATFEEDPAFLVSPLRRYPSRKDYANVLRLAWRGFTGVLNDASLQMRYSGLDRDAQYKIRMVYSNELLDVKVRLDAQNGDRNAIEVHPYLFKPSPHAPLEFDIPHEATRNGELNLRWQREPGLGGKGGRLRSL